MVQSDERQLLWQALRERAEQKYGSTDIENIVLSDEVLAALLGIKESEDSYNEDD